MSKNARLTILVFLVLSSLHLWIYTRLPDADKEGGWTSTVMRNWHESGYWNLSGQLVANPGGLEAGEPRFVYPGHRPYLLVPPYLLKELPGAWGGNGLLLDFAMVLAAFAGIVCLFGANVRGWTIAFVTCLAPGFIANVAKVDTISYPAVTAFAALTFVGAFLVRDDHRRHRQVIAFMVLLFFMVMNWSTLFSLFVLAVYVVCKRPPDKKLVLFAGTALVVGMLVFVASIASRHQGGATASNFWNAYLFGPAGYDQHGMNWSKALLRISGVNLIAWLPVMVAGVSLWISNGRGERWKWAPLPLLAGIFMVLSMRNYNAHHPWGATSMIGLGLVFTLELLIAPNRVAKPAVQSAGLSLGLGFALIYALSWVALDEFNRREENALHDLLAHHTPRRSVIVVADNLLPGTQLNASRLADQFDRKVVVQSDWTADKAGTMMAGHECYLLTPEVRAGENSKLVAHSICEPQWADKIMIPMFDFYRSKISRRSTGDRLVLFHEYQLYKF